MDLPYTVEEIRAAAHELIAANGLASCYLRPLAFYGYGELGVSSDRQPRRRRDRQLPVGRVPRRGQPEPRHHDEDLELGARRAERHPARREGDRDLPQLDARDDGGAARRLRRGDHALARRLRRRRPGREHLRREGRRPLHAAARDVDPARDHARHGHPDRPGSRTSRRGDAADPHRPLPRGRGVHGRHGDRGCARAVGRRPEIGVGPVTRELQKAYLDTVQGRSERWSHWLDVVEMSPSAA